MAKQRFDEIDVVKGIAMLSMLIKRIPRVGVLIGF